MASFSEISADYEPKYSSTSDKIGIQYKHIVDRSAIVSFSSEEENVIKLFRVYIELGAKWAYASDDDSENDSSSDADDKDSLARVEACFIAEYELKEETPQEALEEFA